MAGERYNFRKLSRPLRFIPSIISLTDSSLSCIVRTSSIILGVCVWNLSRTCPVCAVNLSCTCPVCVARSGLQSLLPIPILSWICRNRILPVHFAIGGNSAGKILICNRLRLYVTLSVILDADVLHNLGQKRFGVVLITVTIVFVSDKFR